MDSAAVVATESTPFSAGTVISRSFSVWAGNAFAFFAVVLVLHLPNLALNLLAGPQPVANDPAAFSYTVITGLNGILSALLSFVATGAITYGVVQALRGGRAGAGELLGFGFRKVWPTLVVSLDAGVRISLWTLLLIVPGLIAICRFFVAVPARICEPHLSSGAAVARSDELTRGHRLSIFVVFLLVWSVGFIASALANVLGLRTGVLPFPVAAAIGWAVAAMAGSLWATAAGVTYHALRVAKEGVDVAELAAVFE